MHLRIATFNVQNDEGPPERVGLIATTLRELEPDVVSLQEVSDGDHLDRLLDGTGLHGTFQAAGLDHAMPHADRFGGAAVATRAPHTLLEVLDQRTSDAPDVPWCTLAAAVPVGDLGEMLVVAATGAWRLDQEAARERQVLALADLDARHRRRLPTVIAGDLNASPQASSIRFLTGLQSLAGRSVCFHDAWAVAGNGAGHTWTTDHPGAVGEIGTVVRQPHHARRLDYVLVGSWHQHPDARAEVRAARLFGDRPRDGVWLSDHLGVVVDLEVTVDD